MEQTHSPKPCISSIEKVTVDIQTFTRKELGHSISQTIMQCIDNQMVLKVVELENFVDLTQQYKLMTSEISDVTNPYDLLDHPNILGIEDGSDYDAIIVKMPICVG